ncbi:MAG: serine/threonine-protein kinase [Actinomycetes bacterium]
MTVQPPGSQVAGYRIESMIGRGGMAVVYRAEDVRLGRKVALKLLTPDLAESEQFRQRFIKESRLAASLDHPNIIPIYEAGEADEQLFIAMRYVIGNDLKGLLASEGGTLAGDRTLRLFVQIGNALDSAHEAGLVHRDVKPGNILVAGGQDSRHQRGDHVYLTDFGLTKRTSSLSEGLTGPGHFLGTVDYVSPEQIQGRPVGPSTDIYALGCVLFECLTGQLPFRREDEAALLWAHLVESPPPVTAVRRDLPHEVNEVVERAMAKDPGDRYPSCQELVADLEYALQMPVRVSPPSSRGRRAESEGGEALGSGPGKEPGRDVRTVTGGAQHPSFPPHSIRRLPGQDDAQETSVPGGRGRFGGPGGFEQPPGSEQREDVDEGRRYDDEGYDRSDEYDDGEYYVEDEDYAGQDYDEDDYAAQDYAGYEDGEAAGDVELQEDQQRSGATALAAARRRAWGRWPTVAVAAVAALALVVVAVVLVRSFVLKETFRTYTSTSGETIVPFRIDYPSSWSSVVGPSSDIVMGPKPLAADQLFFNKTADQWAATPTWVTDPAPDNVWVYIYTLASTFDTSSPQALQQQVGNLLPETTKFGSMHPNVTVSGARSNEMEAVTSNPQNPSAQFRVMVDVVQPADADGAVLLAFFAPPGTFDQHMSEFMKVRDSLQVLS